MEAKKEKTSERDNLGVRVCACVANKQQVVAGVKMCLRAFGFFVCEGGCIF